MSRALRLFSCDLHLEHPPSAFKEYVPEQYRHYLDSFTRQLGNGTPDNLFLSVAGADGRFQYLDFGVNDPYADGARIVGAYGGPDEYIEWLDMDGVEAGIVIASTRTLRLIGSLAEKDLPAYYAYVQAFNDWMSDFCNAYPDRLLGAACVPRTGVDDAIAELRRVRKLPGIRTLTPGVFPNGGNRPLPEDDPFWAAALDLDMPVTLHGGLPDPGGKGSTVGDYAVLLLARTATTPGGSMTAAQMICSGLFDRFPTLRVCLPETGAGWVPWMSDQMDNNYYRHRYWSGIDLKGPPSEYLRRGHFLWNIIVDNPAIEMRHRIGVENLSWSSDFPHSATDWPRSMQHCAAMLRDVPEEEQYQILWSNAARFYRLETPDVPRPGQRPSRQLMEA